MHEEGFPYLRQKSLMIKFMLKHGSQWKGAILQQAPCRDPSLNEAGLQGPPDSSCLDSL